MRKGSPLFLARAILLAERVFPAFHFALPDSLRRTWPTEQQTTFKPTQQLSLAKEGLRSEQLQPYENPVPKKRNLDDPSPVFEWSPY